MAITFFNGHMNVDNGSDIETYIYSRVTNYKRIPSTNTTRIYTGGPASGSFSVVMSDTEFGTFHDKILASI